MSITPQERMQHARNARETKSAYRALDDPPTLRRAVRIVRAAMARNVLTLDELTPLPENGDDQ